MADRNELVQQFANVTGVDRDRATFYLESAAWNLEIAMASFYEDGDAEPPLLDEPEESQPPPVPIGGGRGQSTGSSRFATISSLQPDEESDSDEAGQAFYAGGSERSGQQVLGPPKKKKNASVVEDLFKSAREHGAEAVESQAAPSNKKSSVFRGTGYRLGETEGASHVVQGLPVEGSRKQVDMVLKLWKNGFSVDNSELRDFNDPANKEFLDAISRGEVPQELIRQGHGGEVNLNMEDHRHEDYVKPKASLRAFSGAGHMLGSPVPGVIGGPSAATGSQASQSASTASAVKVDESQPTTSIQIRLADGSRLVAKFNHSHTIGDIRNYIIGQRPQYATSSFVLMTTFPNKELANDSETVQSAKLLNAVIVQRLK